MDQLGAGYDDQTVLHQLGFEVEQGEILALLGPSGCGKTTLLRCLSGLEPVGEGRVRIQGQDITNMAPEKRRLGLVFQQPALFPHMDVERNVAYGLEVAISKRRTPTERLRILGRQILHIIGRILPPLGHRFPANDQHGNRVKELLKTVGLGGFEHRQVDTLSGGEAQRVALARALAPEPRVLLLDEPLSSLDRVLRESLRRELRYILKAVGVTAIYVTHDQGEAAAVADRVALMRDGRIVQMDIPARLYQAPVDAWAARFLGLENLVPVDEVENVSHDGGYIKIRTKLKGAEELYLPYPDILEDSLSQGSWEMLLPPGALGLGHPPGGLKAVGLEGTIAELEVKPEGVRMWVELAGMDRSQRFVVNDARDERGGETIAQLGDMVRLWMVPERARLVRG